MKNPIRNLVIALAGVSVLSVMPAYAATSQEDVQTCRVAMVTDAGINLDNYRLRFLQKTGNGQGRTLTLKAIPYKYGNAFTFTCTLNKNIVTALNGGTVVKYARR